jgi:hypothetical protein
MITVDTDCNDCLDVGKVQGDMKTMSETGGRPVSNLGLRLETIRQ